MPEETGLLVPPQDVNAWAVAIERILGNELWSRKLRTQASVRVLQNFSWNGGAMQLSELYRGLLAQSLMDERLWTFYRSQPLSVSISDYTLIERVS